MQRFIRHKASTLSLKNVAYGTERPSPGREFSNLKHKSGISGDTQYRLVDTFTDTDGVLLANHTPDDVNQGLAWSSSGGMKVSSNTIINTDVTLTELVVNGNMELDSDWVTGGSPTTFERSSEQAHGGTYSWKIVADSVGDGMRPAATASVLAGQLLKYTVWAYPVGPADKVLIQIIKGNGSGAEFAKYYDDLTPDAWNKLEGYVWSTTAGSSCDLRASAGEVGTFYFDDMSLKKFNLNDPFAVVSECNSADMWAAAKINTLTDNSGQGGVWVGTDPQNCVRCYFLRDWLWVGGSASGDYLHIDKIVNGVRTQIYTVSRVWEDGLEVFIVKEPSVNNNITFFFLYTADFNNNHQYVFEVTDEAIINGKASGFFMTEGAGDSIDSFRVKEIKYQNEYMGDGTFGTEDSKTGWNTSASNVLEWSASDGNPGGCLKCTYVNYLLAFGVAMGTGVLIPNSVRGRPYKCKADVKATGGDGELALKQEGTNYLPGAFDATDWVSLETFGLQIYDGPGDGNEWEIVNFSAGEVAYLDNYEYYVLV